MKRIIGLLIIMTVAVSLLSGCGNVLRLGESENDILTYEPIDRNKTTLIAARVGNIYATGLLDAFMAANPDVQIIELDVTGGNDTVRPIEEWVLNGLAPDLLLFSSISFATKTIEEHFVNLSANPVTARFNTDALARTAVNDSIYWLPGPSTISCMAYNKTLFEQYGWQVPATFDEFVALCDQITADTEGKVQPWNPNAKYSNELMTALEGFTYGELFAGADNRTWYNEFLAGRATYVEHMRPFYDMLQKLVDHGIVKEEHFTYSATTRGKEFAAGDIAMINVPMARFASEKHEFSFMPFPSTDGAAGYVSDAVYMSLGVSKKTRTDKEQSAIDRFLDFYASAEGQNALIGNLLMVSNVKNVPVNDAPELVALRDTVEAGRMFTLARFTSDGIYANFSFGGDLRRMLSGEKTAEECLSAVDAAPFVVKTGEVPSAVPAIAVADADFTTLDVSNFFADLYRERADAQIGLIANNVAYRGNLMRIFKGDITAGHVTVLKPRSFGNGATLIKVSMTGAQLMAALNDIPANEITVNAVYAYSGLKGTVAPWKPMGEKILDITLSNGAKIEDGQLYTVACWQGTVKDEYITETLESYEGTFEELLTAALEAKKHISPARDGRMKLVWE